GTQSISVNDTILINETGVQTGIVISGTGVTAQFKVSGFPSTINAGTPGSYTVTAQDPFGNLTPAYAGSVTFSTTAASATSVNTSYPCTGAGAGNDNGVHGFTNNATLFTAGTKSLKATDASIPATGSQTVTVRPGSAVSMTASGSSSVLKAGVPENF